jgi:uncharacterized protein YprB with RNaseH-like and TPR domain
MIARIQRQQRGRRGHRRTAPGRIQIESVVEGTLRETPHGPVFVASSEFPLEMRQGRTGPRLRDLRRGVPKSLAFLAREESLADAVLGDFVFFDTETTGLATTSGTYVFLAGLGYVDEGIFVVEQVFMRDYDEEPALLWLLGDRLARFPAIVTYNGRAYDLPLVRARFITNRVFDPPLPELHLDMLHPARKLWRARGSGCRLTELEREILGVERQGDVPGHLIPGIYFDAVHHGNVASLKGVFYHNAQDILSLAALTVAGARLLETAEPLRDAIGEDLYSVARFLEDSGESEALELYRKAFQWGFRDSLIETEALCRIGRLHRRTGDREEALQVFSRLAEGTHPFRAFALIELAKHFEHRERRYEEAHLFAHRALEALRETGEGGPRIPAQFRPRTQDVEHRLRRLDQRRQGRPWRLSRSDARGGAR